MRLKIAVLAGDGIGPEVTLEATNILRAVAELGGHDFTFVPGLIGGVAITETGSPLPTATLDAALESDAVRLGAVGDSRFNALTLDKRPEIGLLQIRQALGGFANLRPSLAFSALSESSPLRAEVTKDVDILFVRELLGGLYFGAPRWWNPDSNEAINTMRYTRDEIVRVARIAFELAAKRRQKVTSVDKANVLEVSQLWRATVTEVAKDYPSVTLEHQLVDSMAMHIMNIPRHFDVVLTENLFGDILSDEAGVITGSLGMLPSATIGGAVNLYEPVHGSAPDIAGTGKANPLGAILTAAMILRHSANLQPEAKAVEQAVRRVLDAGYRTTDISRNQIGQTPVNTQEMGRLVHRSLTESIARHQSRRVVEISHARQCRTGRECWNSTQTLWRMFKTARSDSPPST
jgi:3-isopropylmalate dehydrogenase